MRPTLLLFCFLFATTIFAQKNSLPIPFEQQANYSATYQETIDFYQKLAEQYPTKVKLVAIGTTDSGEPLHTAILASEATFDKASARAKGKTILFVNNAIHPGEPCGVDATMMLFRNYVQRADFEEVMKNIVVVAIPFYNISGGLNRGSFSRANQDGPMEHGFRGNIKNLDLNRDFIKCDSKNARSFNQAFTTWKPDVFIDNHTSNGADYQYTITMIASQKEKLQPVLSDYLQNALLPQLYTDMEAAKWEMTPYVNVQNTPDGGIYGFLDLPRYSSGFATLHNAIGFTSETHMLKPFKDRVLSTYAFMDVVIKRMNKDAETIIANHKKADRMVTTQTTFDLNWQIDTTKKEALKFKGYEAKYKPSEVSGLDRLYYDKNTPFEKDIPFFNTYKTTATASKPVAYIIPQAYTEVIERLQWNGVEVRQLARNTSIEVAHDYIENYETRQRPYEGHYLHYNVETRREIRPWQYRAGDYVVFVNQPINRYIVETLEPTAPDSYFAWNFFDGILMQKEYFSSYVFEDVAAKILAENPQLRSELEAKKAEDADFAKSARAQLDFVYKRSPYYEPTHNLYPVGRILKPVDLSLK